MKVLYKGEVSLLDEEHIIVKVPILFGILKLIKWRFVLHGSIDGYSRVITFLHCSDNNRATTVLSLLTSAVNELGLPCKI